ncbi:MAG: chlorite dismutase [Actinobacteria bacterium]|nr:chlorite dismutase [Actinomycetota bacterium]
MHLFFHVSSRTDRDAVLASISAAQEQGDQVVTAAMLGHKSDVAVLALSTDQWRLRRLQTDLVIAGLDLTESYVSLTELSEYAAGVPEEMQQARLYPVLPPEGKPAFCFYPMSKTRNVGANWYELSFERRKELMYEHGASGRKFAGRLVQLITGSTGLDEYEWGVTLFGDTPDTIKEVVYTMRYDQASTQYGEFGPFYVGMVESPDVVLDEVGV